MIQIVGSYVKEDFQTARYLSLMIAELKHC